MRIAILSHEERNARLAIWHRWFAWHPARVGPCDVRWMETVERRFTGRWCGEYGDLRMFEHRSPASDAPNNAPQPLVEQVERPLSHYKEDDFIVPPLGHG